MSLAYDVAVAKAHRLSTKMVKALLELVEGQPLGGSQGPTFHALAARRLVLISDDEETISPTTAGIDVARRLLGQPAPRPAPRTPAERVLRAELDARPEVVAAVTRSQSDVDAINAQVAAAVEDTGISDPVPPAGPYFSGEATWLIVLITPDALDIPPLAVVVGDEDDAQGVADRWNLARIEQIANQTGAGYAAVIPGHSVEVYVFDRPVP